MVVVCWFVQGSEGVVDVFEVVAAGDGLTGRVWQVVVDLVASVDGTWVKDWVWLMCRLPMCGCASIYVSSGN